MDPSDRKYTKEHEWARIDQDSTAWVGITDYAQHQLGDITYFDLPPPGTRVVQFSKMGEVESVKAASLIYSPLSGEVMGVNGSVVGNPELVQKDPYESWLVKIKVENLLELDNLLTAEEYLRFLDEVKER